MGRKIANKLNDLLKKASPEEAANTDITEQKILYSVIGFVPVSDFVDQALLISNLGYLLAQKGLNTCIVDLKVFFPNLYQFLHVPPHKKGSGLIQVLKNDKIDVRDEIQPTHFDRLYLLSPSPYDLMEEYFDFEMEQVEKTLHILKKMFDLVLIDIPNNPPLEFCLGAMNGCHSGFFTASERIDAICNMSKLQDFISSIGINASKFSNVVLMNMQDVPFDLHVFYEAGFSVVASLPLVKEATAQALEGNLYIKKSSFVNKSFKKELDKLVAVLLEN